MNRERKAEAAELDHVTAPRRHRHLALSHFSLPANYDVPTVQFASRTETASVRYGVFQSRGRLESNAALTDEQSESIVSVYDDRKKRIMLPVEWQGRTPAELSILVHEMVHHLQNQAALPYACPQE